MVLVEDWRRRHLASSNRIRKIVSTSMTDYGRDGHILISIQPMVVCDIIMLEVPQRRPVVLGHTFTHLIHITLANLK